MFARPGFIRTGQEDRRDGDISRHLFLHNPSSDGRVAGVAQIYRLLATLSLMRVRLSVLPISEMPSKARMRKVPSPFTDKVAS